MVTSASSGAPIPASAQAYQDIAAKTGVTPAAAGEATAQQLIGRLAPGGYYKPLNGSWTRK